LADDVQVEADQAKTDDVAVAERERLARLGAPMIDVCARPENGYASPGFRGEKTKRL